MLGIEPSNGNNAEAGRGWRATFASFDRAAKETGQPVRQESDEALAAELDDAARAVQMQAGMERAGIEGDYAARSRYARRHMTRQEAAAAVTVLRQQKAAALAALARKTALLMRTRLAAIRARRRIGDRPAPR